MEKLSGDSRAFYFPKSLHIDQNEEITVIDNWNYRITRFNKEGQIIASNYGPGDESFLKHSNDVHAHTDGTIFAANTGDSRIEIVNPDGTYGSIGGNGRFNGPEGLFVSEEGLIYLADTWANRVQILDLQGQFLRELNFTGQQMRHPVDVVALDNQILVLDDWLNAVLVFSPDGNFLRSFGISSSHSAGSMDTPSKMAVDSERGLIYVTDSDNHRIVVFQLDGQYAGQIGSKGVDFGQFRNPKGIAVDKDGYIYVADRDNSRIQILPPFLP